MLRRISTQELELGMFIHKLEGSWLDHPFWKSRFLLDDALKLAMLRESDVESVVIDVARGKAPGESTTGPGLHTATATASGQSAAAVIARETPVDRLRRVRASFREPVAPGRRPATSFGTAPRRPLQLAPGALRATEPQPMTREFGLAEVVATQSRQVICDMFLAARLGKALKIGKAVDVVEDIYSSVQRNPHAFSALMRCKEDCEFIFRRALSVSALMVSLARQMQMSRQDVLEAGTAGLMMDIGASMLPAGHCATAADYLMLKPEVWMTHVDLGYDRLRGGDEHIPDAVLRVCKQHHERLDGSGYPLGLAGDQIDMLSRMAAICDAFDEIVTTGNRGEGIDPALALRHLSELDRKYDAAILRHFVEALGVYPVGGFVRLASNELAMVIDQAFGDPARLHVVTIDPSMINGQVDARQLSILEVTIEQDIAGTADLTAVLAPGDQRRLRAELMHLACGG